MVSDKTFIYPLKTEFEDVDAGGVVHHPTYMKFYERARCHQIAEGGYSFDRMLKEGLAVAVAEAYQSYRRPIGMYQTLQIVTRVVGVRRSNLKVRQAIVGPQVSREQIDSVGDDLEKLPELYHWMDVRLVCVSLKEMKPLAAPAELLSAMGIPDLEKLPESFNDVRVKP
jgi:acyl-CoA thioester hydrolase